MRYMTCRACKKYLRKEINTREGSKTATEEITGEIKEQVSWRRDQDLIWRISGPGGETCPYVSLLMVEKLTTVKPWAATGNHRWSGGTKGLRAGCSSPLPEDCEDTHEIKQNGVCVARIHVWVHSYVQLHLGARVSIFQNFLKFTVLCAWCTYKSWPDWYMRGSEEMPWVLLASFLLQQIPWCIDVTHHRR